MHVCKRGAFRPAETPSRLRGDSLFTKLRTCSTGFPCDSASFPAVHVWGDSGHVTVGGISACSDTLRLLRNHTRFGFRLAAAELSVCVR